MGKKYSAEKDDFETGDTEKAERDTLDGWNEDHLAEKSEFEAGYTARVVSDASDWLGKTRLAKKKRIHERIVKENIDIAVPQVMNVGGDIWKIIPQERVRDRTAEQIIDVPQSRTRNASRSRL